MTPNRITRAGAVRRALAAALAALALAAGLGACGGGDSTSDSTASSTDADAADAALLNEVLARQLGVRAAYPRAMAGTAGQTLALLQRFRTQEGEHADGIVEALRGLGEDAEAEPEAIESGALRTRAERLTFAYEMESATIEAELSAIGKLSAESPRRLLAATVANQAQHLTILRRLLGAKPVATIPAPFEAGSTPAP